MILAFGLGDGDTPEQAMQWIERGNAPAVSLAWEWRHERLPMIATDREAVMVSAADYLQEIGMDHVAFVYDAGDLVDSARIQKGSSAFVRRATELGCEACECVMAVLPEGSTADFERVQHEEELVQFITESPKPLGLFCITDLHARAVCHLCEKLGFDIPGDVSILGCGDLTIARRHSPTISSIRTSPEEIGYEAVGVLDHILEGGALPKKPRLFGPQEIIERESTCVSDGTSDDFRLAYHFIHRHACEGINVADVVQNVAISRRRLEMQFQDIRGHSPGQEIKNVRLAKAKRLLSETTLPITRIAELVGFREHSRFTTFFRKQTGMTPTAFREQP